MEKRKEYVVDARNGFEALKQCIDFIKEELSMDGSFYSDKKRKHQDKYIFRGLRRAIDAGVKSGAAIRIERKYGNNYSFIDYIDYHKKLIEDTRKKFPENCKGKCDLDILADLQHNGTATCLVDFTFNFFAALWFACGKAESDDCIDEADKDGLLYCLNINDCLINNETMLVITENNKNKPIDELLKMTQRFADIDAKYKYKFWYWQPNKFNDRVSVQDGIFVFGMEKFDLTKNHVKVLRIKRHCKEMILDVMAKFFNISVTTIYPDINGYADANSKFMEIEDSNWEGHGCLSRGVMYMLHGDNRMALDYFDRFESCMKSKDRNKCKYITSNCFSGMINMMELYYYKAEAFNYANHPNRAILNYREVRATYNKEKAERIVRSMGKRGEQLISRAENRVFTSYSRELFLMYDTKRFEEGIQLCKEIIDRYDGDKVNIDYAKISLIELELINADNTIQTSLFDDYKKEKTLKECYAECKEYIKIFTKQIPKGGFYALLLLFFDYVAQIYCNQNKKYDINQWIEKLWQLANNIKGQKSELICDWYLDDIKNIVENTSGESSKYSDLLYLIARFNEIQDYLQIKLLKREIK